MVSPWKHALDSAEECEGAIKLVACKTTVLFKMPDTPTFDNDETVCRL